MSARRFLENLVQRWPRGIMLGFAIVGALCGVLALQVRIDTSVDSLLIENDPRRQWNQDLKSEFSNDELILIAFDLDRPFVADDLRKLRTISEEIEAIPRVEEVADLSNAKDVLGDGYGINGSPLIDWDTLDQDIDSIRARVRGHRLYDRVLVSPEQDVLLIIVLLPPDIQAPESHGVAQQIVAVAERSGAPWNVYSSGYAVAESEANRIARKELSLLTGVALICVLAIVYAVSRRTAAVALLLALIGWVELATHGWLALSDTPLSVVTSAVPTIALTIASTYAIYLIGLLQRSAGAQQPAIATLRLLFRPVLLSGASTTIGFISLRSIEVRVIGELGTTLAFACMAAVLGALLLLPAMIQWFGIRVPATRSEAVDRWSVWGIRLARRPAIPITIACVVVSATFLGSFRLTVDSDILLYFKPDNPMRASSEFIRDRLSGPFVEKVVLRTQEPDGALNPEVLALAEGLSHEIPKTGPVGRVISFLDYAYLMDAAMRPEEVPRSVLPSRELAAQYMLLYESGADPDDYRHYINFDRSALCMVALTASGSTESMQLRHAVERYVADHPVPGVDVQVLGTGHLFAIAMDGIVRGLVRGLLVAFVLIVVALAFFLRSWKLALIAAVPNAVPIMMCTGVLGWLGFSLSLGTSVVGCLSLGLAVDDTAHVLGHVDRKRSLRETYLVVGRPMMITTLALGLGFSTLVLSEFRPVAMLGAATALTLLAALIFDLLLLPSLLAVAGYRLEPEPADSPSGSPQA